VNKKLFVILIVGILGTVISVNYAFGDPLTNVVISPSNNEPSRGNQFVVMFTTTKTDVIKTIEIQFQSGTKCKPEIPNLANGIGPGTLTCDTNTGLATYTVTSPVSVPAGTTITMLLGKTIHSPDRGCFFASLTTKDSTGTIIDGPTSGRYCILGAINVVQFDSSGNVDIPGNLAVGTGVAQERLDVSGNIRLTGNIVSPNDICIGNCP